MAGKISSKQVNGLDSDLESIEASISSIVGFSETGGFVYGNASISGAFSQIGEFSSLNVDGPKISFSESSEAYGVGPSGQIWLNGESEAPSTYLEATGEHYPEIKFLYTNQLDTGSFSIKGNNLLVNSDNPISFAIKSEEIVSISQNLVNFNKQTSFDGNVIKSSGMSVTQDSLIESVDTDKHSVAFLTISASSSASSSCLYERLYFNWDANASGMNYGSSCSLGDQIGAITGNLTEGMLNIHWSGQDSYINYMIKKLKKV